jgi:acetyl-CoA carboxylase carboxyltransferase component
MRVAVSKDATAEEIEALAVALADHLGEPVEAVRAGSDDVVATADPPAGAGAPTERERQLREEIAEIRRGGPETYRERLAETGKLFVRDRLGLWFGGFDAEDGRFAAYDDWHPASPETEYDPDRRLPGDGLLTGLATFEGRQVHVMANDYTVKAGSMARRGVEKFLRMQERALRSGRPVLYLMDSSGGRIDEQTGFFANRQGIGRYYYNHSMLSGRVPQICVLYGPCIAGAAYTPVFADFTVMVEGSAMAIASPRMVEMVTGEEISLENLGGPEVHARYTGSADLVAADEREARDLVADLLSYLPDRAGQSPPQTEGGAPAVDPTLLDEVIPDSPSTAYNVRDVLEYVVDADSLFELRPRYGAEVLTAFARVDGRPVGVVASQPAVRSGAIFPDAARKAAEFVWTCDAYEVPLLYLCDTPGFMAGSQVEREGILEAGKRMIYATSAATVPKQTVVTRKAYGAGIYAMGGPAYEPESVLALPSAEIAIMGPEAAIRAVHANRLDAVDDPEERAQREAELRAEYREEIDARRMASEVVIDEVVPPGDLRAELVTRFAFYEDVERSLPERKHGTVL